MRPFLPLDGPALIDRASDRRREVDLSSLGAVIVSSGAVLMDGERPSIVPASERPSASSVSFIGSVGGRDLAAVGVEAEYEPGPPSRMVPLREVFAVLSGDDSKAMDVELVIMAVGMAQWHERNAFCSRCGLTSEPDDGGWVRRCSHGHESFPRTDPAVIVAITDERDRLLLAHIGARSPGRYSHLAGYIEPGESFEQAAHRETREEASLQLEGLEYIGSQPWPFPASIMVAFQARAASRDLKVDGVEVTDAFWATRDGLRERLTAGTCTLAVPGTVARALVQEWYGGDPVKDAGVMGE